MKNYPSARFCVAPMMARTDRHCRYFHRLLSKRALLFTEMVVDGAIINGERERFLGYAREEHPLALQIGGSDPERLFRAGIEAQARGFDEVNLNAGCPSPRVQSGRFGAVLMKDPAHVKECLLALTASGPSPVSIKCRIGVDDQEPSKALPAFIEAVASTPVRRVYVHARKAYSAGLDPRANRTIPPLNYALVFEMKRRFPDMEIILNGGLQGLDEALPLLAHLDGVMMGRAAFGRPRSLLEVDRLFYKAPPRPRSLHKALDAYAAYGLRQMGAGEPLRLLARPLSGLMQGFYGARHLREKAFNGPQNRSDAFLDLLRALPKA